MNFFMHTLCSLTMYTKIWEMLMQMSIIHKKYENTREKHFLQRYVLDMCGCIYKSKHH